MKYIEKTYGKEYVGALRKFKEKETAQGAHECIRPTSLQKAPLQGKEKELYELIFKRTLASLMAPAILIKKKAMLVPLYEKKKGEEMNFVAKGSELFFLQLSMCLWPWCFDC